MSVIVTNARSRIAYNIARSLSKKGVDVYTSDSSPAAMAFSSRYSKGHFLYPSPFRQQEQFIECLIDNVHKYHAEVLIPTLEESYLISKYKHEISKHVKVVLPDYEQILMVHNKDRWSLKAAELGILVPRTHTVSELHSDNSIITDLRYPVLIKPKQGGGGWAISRVDSPSDLKKIVNAHDHNGLSWDRFFVQERIEGHEHCVAMLYCNGSYRAKVAYRQLRDYPIDCGQATLRISSNNKDAEYSLQKLLDHLSWHGVCQADFIIDKKTNAPYLIDMNPRFWGSLAQSIASGVDFPYLVYEIATKGDIDPILSFQEGKLSQWLGGDVGAVISLLRRDKKLKSLGDFSKLLFKNVYRDDFELRDPLPFIYWTYGTLLKVINKRSMNPESKDALDGMWK